MTRVLPLLLLLVLLTWEGHAQIVNIEKKRLGKFEEGWFGNVDLGVNLTQNTKTIWQIQNRANVQRNWKRHSLMVMGDVKLVMVESDRFLNSGFGHLRYNRPLSKSRRITLEAFSQFSYNKPQRIDRRGLNGLGARFSPIVQDSLEVHIGTLIMHENELISDTSLINIDWRASTYLSLTAQFNPKIALNSITYFQPRLDEPADFRLSNESSLIFSISKRFAFRVTWNMVYDTKPPGEVPELNYKLYNKLSFRF